MTTESMVNSQLEARASITPLRSVIMSISARTRPTARSRPRSTPSMPGTSLAPRAARWRSSTWRRRAGSSCHRTSQGRSPAINSPPEPPPGACSKTYQPGARGSLSIARASVIASLVSFRRHMPQAIQDLGCNLQGRGGPAGAASRQNPHPAHVGSGRHPGHQETCTEAAIVADQAEALLHIRASDADHLIGKMLQSAQLQSQHLGNPALAVDAPSFQDQDAILSIDYLGDTPVDRHDPLLAPRVQLAWLPQFLHQFVVDLQG